MPEPTLAVSGLALVRGSARLGPVSFTLPHPGCWWLTGASGAGKSLLLESLAGFHSAATGSVRVGGREVAELAPERRCISLMPQRWRLFPHWTVARNLHFAAKRSASSAERIEHLAERLEITSLLKCSTRALSGGETQRAALLQTILSPAVVLLLDEPLSAVDATLQSTVLDLLQEESAANRRICLLAAHRAAPEHPLKGQLLLKGGCLAPAQICSAL